MIRPTCPKCGRPMSIREDRHGMYLLCYGGLQYLDPRATVVGGCLWTGDFRDMQIEHANKVRNELDM